MGIIPDPIPHQLHLSGGLFLLDLSHLPHLSGSAHSCVVMTTFMLLSFKFLFQMQASLLSSIQDIWPECLINMSNTDRSCHSSSQASSCPGFPALLHGTLFTQPAEYHSWLVYLTHCSMLGCTYGQLYFNRNLYVSPHCHYIISPLPFLAWVLATAIKLVYLPQILSSSLQSASPIRD